MYIKYEDLKDSNNSWLDQIPCETCKQFFTRDVNSILDNIKNSKTIKEYQKKEKKSQKRKHYITHLKIINVK